MEPKRPFFLLTNDDGIHAPGIRHLWEAVHPFADVAIVAPSSEKSGSGASITWTQPLVIHKVIWEKNTPAYSVNGTPADCVKMALSVILDKRPDMVLSGVNRGSNSGRTVLYSGTVGGVIEGAYKGIAGIAFSYSDFEDPPLDATRSYFLPLIQHLLENPLPHGSFLNVNFPFLAKEGIKGVKMARQGKGLWVESPDKRTHPVGQPYYWLGGKWASHENEHPESDVAWLEKGYIAAVPIHVGEMTDLSALELHKSSLEQRFTGFFESSPSALPQ